MLSFASVLALLSLTAGCSLADNPEPVRLRVNDPSLRKYLGQQVIVAGRVSRASRSNSGHNFLNFNDNQNFSVVCFRDDVRNFGKTPPAERYRGKFIEICGKLEQFKGKLQIRLTEPGQIRETTPSSVVQRLQLKPVRLRQIGPDSWISPAGLRYTGRDPEGRTRVEHILRHTKDEPDRDGPHGVFDCDEEYVFALLDKAWQTAKQKNIRPRREGDRSSFTISMGTRVGYLGGRTGRQRGNPPLSRVFIVVRAGTSDVITAFPK